jgi:hypothetical protein
VARLGSCNPPPNTRAPASCTSVLNASTWA